MAEPDFPDHDYLTVKELADLLRLKERKVYDLAASGAVPCSRATGKLLFPSGEIRAWIDGAKTGGSAGLTQGGTAPAPIILGSHDPLLDWAIRESRCGLATFHDGSRDGLDRFVKGEGIAAGLHIHNADEDSWNITAAQETAGNRNAVLIAFANRRRGLVFDPQRCAPAALTDLAGLRLVPRQAGSGTDTVFRQLAERHGLDLSDVDHVPVARTEDDAVEAVRRGDGDVAFGLEAVALGFGLSFHHIIDEAFALIVDRKAFFDPAFQTLLAFCRTDSFQARAAGYGGYDVADLGRVLWNS